MRVFAMLDGRAAGWSVGGTMTVVFMGAVFGAVGGALLWGGRRIFPRTPWARGLLFWGAIVLLGSRLLSPLTGDSLIAFTPFALLYGAVLYRVWCRVLIARWSAAAATPAIAPPS
jgi:hypothetical protein